eukprot:CAMPEP_0206191170 /NCGR_PEP_ID=MMETSP0166-20121206/5203_1 /ASSEMBLY_ACC=CAM_ASM_000260 /TAXON_ID=95228 /ORGANISM="Vannella robusta, Strain DIVA3 518/3/11/1/6" /LENGTH=203 /DNA_ID=CAMNT_0053607423 /DNA_START=18 /DNA_END=629 /DNA_ORIENTATION=+
MSVNCPDALDNITRFASQRWIAQCEFMRALESLLQMMRDDDAALMKGVLKYGYGHYSSIRADKHFEFDDETLQEKLKPYWERKTTKEKLKLGYAVKGAEAPPGAKPNAKRKLKEDPFEFPSTTTLNSHIKHFLKANHLLDNDTAQAAPPKPKPKKKKRKPAAPKAAKKPPIAQPLKRDTSPEHFVKKKPTKKKRSSSSHKVDK